MYYIIYIYIKRCFNTSFHDIEHISHLSTGLMKEHRFLDCNENSCVFVQYFMYKIAEYKIDDVSDLK